MEFISPTKGRLTLEEVYHEIVEYVSRFPEDNYRLIIGTDSQLRDTTCFVTALIVHREGKGGRFLLRANGMTTPAPFGRGYLRGFPQSEHRFFVYRKTGAGRPEFNMEIHLDVGTNGGATRSLVKEVVGMVNGSGYLCRIKPDSYGGASSVADRYTK